MKSNNCSYHDGNDTGHSRYKYYGVHAVTRRDFTTNPYTQYILNDHISGHMECPIENNFFSVWKTKNHYDTPANSYDFRMYIQSLPSR